MAKRRWMHVLVKAKRGPGGHHYSKPGKNSMLPLGGAGGVRRGCLPALTRALDTPDGGKITDLAVL